MTTELKLYNTLTRSKEIFTPIDANNVRMYVCGPTVYDFAHIGNARPVIVFDVLNRLLRHLYGAEHVTYVRNITDVDDKINARALRDYPDLPLNEAIRKVTEKTANQFHEDVKALGCLEPDVEPRATDNIAQMIEIIETLIEKGHAYNTSGEVLFDTVSMKDYGQLSKRNLDEQQAGARIAVDVHKKNPGDFVLWKLSSDDEPGWDSPWGRGRPGWHIECSAMSKRYLGEVFDIHGGGLDLIFPHHENEIAQSRCAHDTKVMANVWMHNGFLQVEGKKMSKSDGNFVTIHELLHTEKFGGRRWDAHAVRLAMLRTHYKGPIDWTVSKLTESEQLLEGWSQFSWNQNLLGRYEAELPSRHLKPMASVLVALADDLNTPLAISKIVDRRKLDPRSYETMTDILDSLAFMGIARADELALFSRIIVLDSSLPPIIDYNDIARGYRIALANGDDEGAMKVVGDLKNRGIELAQGKKRGEAELKDIRVGQRSGSVGGAITQRLAFLTSKNFAEADRIRDELLAQGIQLKDSKDSVTGERVTTWEVKR